MANVQVKTYFDHASTTPLDPEVLDAMLPFLKEDFGNASSVHWFGQVAAVAVENARNQIAKYFGCRPNEVYFTSGATESNNLVIKGLPKAGDHIIVSQIEHPSILEPARMMERQGVEVTYLPVDKNGLISLTELKDSIKNNTILVSVMYVNNEIGTIQPIKEISNLIKELNESREQKIFFHTDAVQAANYCDLGVIDLGVDLMSLSAHKIYGPKGIGLLFRRSQVPLNSLLSGGGQEYALRSGTLNVPGILGFGKAFELLQGNRETETKRVMELRSYLLKLISQKIPEAKVNGDLDQRVVNNINLIFSEHEGETILMLLDQAGFAVSSGSACSSGSLDPSHVLLALGLSNKDARSSVRITLGRNNNREQIDQFVDTLVEVLQK